MKSWIQIVAVVISVFFTISFSGCGKTEEKPEAVNKAKGLVEKSTEMGKQAAENVSSTVQEGKDITKDAVQKTAGKAGEIKEEIVETAKDMGKAAMNKAEEMVPEKYQDTVKTTKEMAGSLLEQKTAEQGSGSATMEKQAAAEAYTEPAKDMAKEAVDQAAESADKALEDTMKEKIPGGLTLPAQK